jgi:hypothetical protein
VTRPWQTADGALRFFQPFFHDKMRTFPVAQEDAAIAWATGQG